MIYKVNNLIRITKHILNFSNINKLDILSRFLNEYRFAVQKYIDHIYNNVIITNGKIVFDRKNNIFNLPLYLEDNLSFESNLSARARKCAITQASSIIRGVFSEKRKLLYYRNKAIQENKSTKFYDKKLSELRISKPKLNDNFNAELNSICVEFIKDNRYFQGFVKLKSIGKAFGSIYLPIKFHKMNKKWDKDKPLSGILVSKKFINLRWEFPDKIKDKKSINNRPGEILGIDSGLNNVITTSSETLNPQDKHSHTLNSINNKLSRKRKGSKAFKKTTEHRENYINWFINQHKCQFENAKEIRFEDVKNLRKGKRTSRKLSHWTYTTIKRKVCNFAEELGVPVILQSSAYRSQRCSNCGFVKYSNRQGDLYKCSCCGFICQSDKNAALNHVIDLPGIPDWVFANKLNRKGFYWLESGVSLLGQELTVPVTHKR